MIGALFVSAAVIGAFALFCWLGFQAMERESWRYGAATLAWLTLCVAVMIYAAQKEEEKGPCLREETGYINNGKGVMTPYTYCAERGTWVEGERR